MLGIGLFSSGGPGGLTDTISGPNRGYSVQDETHKAVNHSGPAMNGKKISSFVLSRQGNSNLVKRCVAHFLCALVCLLSISRDSV